MDSPTPLVTATELAAHYGISRATVYNLLKQGLPSIKIGGSRRFRLADTDAWCSRQANRDAA